MYNVMMYMTTCTLMYMAVHDVHVHMYVGWIAVPSCCTCLGFILNAAYVVGWVYISGRREFWVEYLITSVWERLMSNYPLPPLPLSLTPQLCTKLAQGLVQGVTTQLQDLTSRKKGLLKKVHSSPSPIVTTNMYMYIISTIQFPIILILSFTHSPMFPFLRMLTFP